MTSPDRQRGKLKIFLGYAAGVGKTFQMLDEGQELRARGIDVIVGYFEPHGRKDTIAKIEGLEMIPRKQLEYRGSLFEEMDTDAILKRHPQVALVDEYPHTNIPGSTRLKRWEDVEDLLEAGIDVYTTMNIQHLESLNDQVWQITGIRVRETIPDWVVQRADEVVMVDVTPRALLNRLERGVVYGREKAQRALENFFRESTLVGLRELALRQTAHEVEQRQPALSAPHRHHRILIHLTAEPATAMLIRRAKRVADFLDADCFAVAVEKHRGQAQPDAIERHLNFARNMHIETRVLDSDDPAAALVEFARLNQVTQIFLLRPKERPVLSFLNRDVVQNVVRLANEMQVVIVAERKLVEQL
ncbi:MAG TPA: sensor histidine kinase KdpD [Bryobacteraceae bacterium]|nr:sensor histidine kinase KdpD [Bryobacteraceae bacterium]